MAWYAKLHNGGLELAPNPLKTNYGDVFTNDPAIYAENGYKPVTFTAYPNDGLYYISGWEESEVSITQTWTATERPASPQAMLDIITGGD